MNCAMQDIIQHQDLFVFHAQQVNHLLVDLIVNLVQVDQAQQKVDYVHNVRKESSHNLEANVQFVL